MRVTNYKKIKIITAMGNVDTCPLCGASNKYDIINPSLGGVERIRHVWFKRFIKLYKYTQDRNKCHSCEARWKSEIKKEVIKEGND